MDCFAAVLQHAALWRAQLRCGFNVLLYGFGSKMALVQVRRGTGAGWACAELGGGGGA